MDKPNDPSPLRDEEPPPLPTGTKGGGGFMDKLVVNFSGLRQDPKGWFQALPLWRKALMGLAVAWTGLTLLANVFDNQALTCADEATRAQVMEVVDSHLQAARWYQEAKAQFDRPRISEIRTVRANKELRQYSCAAKYSFDIRGSTREVDFTYDVDYLEDEKKSRVLVDVNTVMTRYMTAAIGL